MDPWALFRLPLAAFRFWQKRVPAKALFLGMGASTLAVIIYGCVEAA